MEVQHVITPNLCRPLALLGALAVSTRVIMFLVCSPAAYPDSETYYLLISHILSLDFSNYVGHRSPGYSVLIFLGDLNEIAVWMIQSVLGVTISFLLFWICFLHTGSERLAFVAGLVHTISLNQLAFETRIMPETLTTFCIVLSIACLAQAQTRHSSSRAGTAVGFLAAAAALTRPLYVYLGPLYVLLVLMFERNLKRVAVNVATVFLVLVLGWMLFNKMTIDYFGLQTVSGYGITNHSGRFMESASDEHAMIRDIYLKHRQQNIERTGSHSMTIFLAKSEMLEKTGLDEVALSRQLAKISFELFMKEPSLYLRGVGEAWLDFWRVRLDIGENFTVPAAREVTYAVWRVERWLLMLTNLFAVLACVWIFARDVARRFQGRVGLSIPLIIVCTIVTGSVLQALAEYGENPRYAVPTQSIAVLLVLLAAWDLRTAYKLHSVGTLVD